MQRSKASVSVEVKQVIGALCKLLSASGLDAVPTPENFRRAKFGGGPDVEKHFCQLLVNILQKTCPVSLEISKHLKGGSELWKLVTAGLWQTGYYAEWMYKQPVGKEGSENFFSSRDLLLALGWLMATGTLEKLVLQQAEQLDKTLLRITPLNLESLRVSPDIQLNSNSLRRIQWCIGCLRHQGRILLSMQEEKVRLLHRILSVSLSSSVDSAISNEGSALIKEDCACLRELCDLLEAYLKWKKVENIFWIWMDSVVDCHLADFDARKPAQAPVRSSDICLHGNRGLEKLEDMLLRLPSSQKGPSQSRGDTEDGEQASDGAQGGFDTSLEKLLYPQPSLSQAFRARLQDKRPKRKACSQALFEMSASEASELLMQTEAQLLEKRDKQRLANRMQLEEMIESLDQLVLIPP